MRELVVDVGKILEGLTQCETHDGTCSVIEEFAEEGRDARCCYVSFSFCCIQGTLSWLLDLLGLATMKVPLIRR